MTRTTRLSTWYPHWDGGHTFKDDTEGTLADFLANAVVDTDDVGGVRRHGEASSWRRVSLSASACEERTTTTLRSKPNRITQFTLAAALNVFGSQKKCNSNVAALAPNALIIYDVQF